jgi:hypothetical protein
MDERFSHTGIFYFTPQRIYMSVGTNHWNNSTNQIDIIIPPADPGQANAGYATITITCTNPNDQKKVILASPSNQWTSQAQPGGATWTDTGNLSGGTPVNSALTQQNKNGDGKWVAGPTPGSTANGNTTTYTFANNGITTGGGETSITITMQASGGGL